MSISQDNTRIRSSAIWIGLSAVLLLAIGAAIFAHYMRPPEVQTGLLNVPLGVEQAAIVTYSGPPVTVAPYKWGVAVNVRIATVTEQTDRRVYDVRYIVNREGTFDLRDYLKGVDGAKLSDLPAFQFHGDPKLSKNLDARIRETEEVKIEVGGYYYRSLAALAIFWIAWLLLLIFWKRPRKHIEETSGVREPTLAERIRARLAQMQAGTLDADEKAELEMLLLKRWREDLALEDESMFTSMITLRRHEKTREPLRQIQRFLHDPAFTTPREEVAAALAPFATDPQPVAAPAQS